ncbi:MAG TPA: L-serine ammonia-lyase [Tepidisphaeraceae bacterium]|jgi:L-serine dehydratase
MLSVLNNPVGNGGGCGTCHSGGCGTCGSESQVVVQPPAKPSRREFGRIALAASAGVALARTARAQPAAAAPAGEAAAVQPVPLSPDLNVVKESKGPILTVLEEFYKIGPGPSSSHTMGPMRITYDFFQRVSKLPEDQLKRATALKVHLFGSLSQTGEGHGTNRAALAGILGKSPATCPPEFLDSIMANPDRQYPVTLGPTTLNVSLKDIIFDSPKGDFPHPNTMTCVLLAGDQKLYDLEYYSVGGGFIEWRGYTPPEKGQPKYPYAHAKELKKYLYDDKVPLPKLLLENEMSISGKSEKEIWEFVDQVADVMTRMVDTGLTAESVLPGPIKLHSKAAGMMRNMEDDPKGSARRAVSQMAAYGFAAAEENARGHIIVTAPTGGSAGIIPAVLKSLRDTNTPAQQIREGFLAAAAIGYLCKHNATLSGAEGGCQAEVGVGSSMGAAMIAQALGAPPKVVANAAESSLEHHLGMTCDPVAGYVQVPCIERCAYGAVKAWTGYCIASTEVAEQRRLDLDTTIAAMALTAKEMNSKYKETSEGGLAVSVVLC